MLEVSSSVNKWRTEGDKKDGKGNTRGHRKSAGMWRWWAKVCIVRTQTRVLELARPWHPHKACSQTSALSHYATQWADTPMRRKKSGVILTILSQNFTKPGHTRQLMRKSAVLVPALEVRDEGTQEDEKTYIGLFYPCQAPWPGGSSWNRGRCWLHSGTNGRLLVAPSMPPRRLAMKPESPPSLLTARGRHVLSKVYPGKGCSKPPPALPHRNRLAWTPPPAHPVGLHLDTAVTQRWLCRWEQQHAAHESLHGTTDGHPSARPPAPEPITYYLGLYTLRSLLMFLKKS